MAAPASYNDGMERPTVIIWDFFGVICSEIAPHWLAERLPPDRVNFVKEELVGPADRGEVTEATMFANLGRIANEPLQKVEQDWYGLAEFDPGVRDVVVRCWSKGHPMGLLTNAPAHFARRLIERSGLAPLFESIVISSECGTTKPDLAIYNLVLGELGVDARSAVMIDDNPLNVAGAEAAGMRGILFESAEQIKKELSGLSA